MKDPKKGRDSRKTPEERKNPTIKKKEEELAKAGIIRLVNIIGNISFILKYFYELKAVNHNHHKMMILVEKA